MTPEGRVKKTVDKALLVLGSDVWRFMPVQTGFGAPALDYLLCVRGQFVAIETKAPGKNLTPMQKGTKAAIEDAGGIVLVVWDETSLEIAMKVILALEFAPHATPSKHFTKRPNIIAALIAGRGDYKGQLQAKRIIPDPEAEGPFEQHSSTFLVAHALNEAACRDNGASGEQPEGRPKPRSRRKNK